MNRHRIVVVAAFIAAVALSFVPVADGAGLAAVVAEIQTPEEWLPAAQLSGLNGLETAVELNYRDAALARVLEDLGERADFDVYFLSQADLTLNVSVAVSGKSVRDVLGLLADLRGVEYRVVDAQTLIVRTSREARLVRRAGREDERAAGDEPHLIRRLPKEPMPVGGEIQEPQRIHYVAPAYPDEARRAGTAGTVVLQAVIDREGNVKEVEVLSSLDPGLDAAAIDAVKQWKYTPTRYDGEAVEVIVTVTVVFRLAQ